MGTMVGVIIAILLYAFVIFVAMTIHINRRQDKTEETLKDLREMIEYFQSKHVCGLQGFNPNLGDRCSKCEEGRE